MLGQKSCRKKVPRIFEFLSRIVSQTFLRIFPEFSPNFSYFVSQETERLRNFNRNPLHFSMPNPHASPKTNIHKIWADANGGVTNGGLRGVWLPFPEIGRNWPFSPFVCLFSPFFGGPEEHLENPENGGKRPFSSDILGFP